MPWTVIWLLGPQNALASIWMGASDRRAVTRAADEIDRRLRLDPAGAGTAAGSVWRLRVSPLEVTYTIEPLDRQVVVQYVSLQP